MTGASAYIDGLGPFPRDVIRYICNRRGISEERFYGKDKGDDDAVAAKVEAVAYFRLQRGLSFPTIAEIMKRHHVTIIDYLKKAMEG